MSGKPNPDREPSCKTDPDCPPIHKLTHPLRYYEFTDEEVKVLEECDKESFYQRCLPLSTVFATLTYAAVRSGCLARNPHFGAAPKVLLAILLGHVAGRLSYLRSCEEKLRSELPSDSHLSTVMQKYFKEREGTDDTSKAEHSVS